MLFYVGVGGLFYHTICVIICNADEGMDSTGSCGDSEPARIFLIESEQSLRRLTAVERWPKLLHLIIAKITPSIINRHLSSSHDENSTISWHFNQNS